MGKINWMSTMYRFFCWWYIEKKPEETKETLEKLIFLIQYDSLKDKKNKKPFIPYKIYIEGNTIRVRFISDVLRVTRLMPGDVFAKALSPSWHNLINQNRYIKLAKKYQKLPKEEIERRVQEILENETLDPKYFVYGKYKDNYMRKLARIHVLLAYHRVTVCTWGIGLAVTGSMIVILVYFPIFLLTSDIYDPNIWNRYFVFGITTVISSIVFYIWTNIVTKPTQYEIDNNYVD